MTALLRALLRVVGTLCYVLGIHRVLIRARRERATVLLYHAVERVEGPTLRGLRSNTHPARFRAHLRFLRSHFRVVPLPEALRAAVATTDGAPCVAITFDDGYRSVLTEALPALREHDMPATLFVVTSVLSSARPVWVNELTWHLHENAVRTRLVVREHLHVPAHLEEAGAIVRDVQGRCPQEEIEGALAEIRAHPATLPSPDAAALFLSRDELAAMRRQGFALGSHTTQHPNLRLLGDAALARELADSLAAVRELGGVPALAYPFGEVDARVRTAAIAAGYDTLLEVGGVNPRGDADPGRVSRVPVGETSVAGLVADMLVVEPVMGWLRRTLRGAAA